MDCERIEELREKIDVLEDEYYPLYDVKGELELKISELSDELVDVQEQIELKKTDLELLKEELLFESH